jgi:hypothetical protein
MPAPVAVLALALAACGNTHMVTSWRAHDVQPVSAAGRRIATVFITDDIAGRHAGEDALAQELERMGARGVPSYSILHDMDPKNDEQTRAQLAAAHIDGVVVMRVIAVGTQITTDAGYVAVPRYRTFWGYWDYGWGSIYEPGYIHTDTQVMTETLVYSLEPDKLLWAGTSETFDPSSVRSAVRHIAREAAEKMADQGVLVR